VTRVLPAGAVAVWREDGERVELDPVPIQNQLGKAGVPESEHGAIVRSLQGLIDDYVLSRIAVQQGATPAQVADYASRLAKAVSVVRGLTQLNAPTHPAADAVLSRAMLTHGLDPELPDHLGRLLSELAVRVAMVAREVGPPQPGGGKAAVRKRQAQLAHALLIWAETFGLPKSTNPNGLLAHTLDLCLQKLGEQNSHPARLLDDVMWTPAGSDTNVRKALGMSKDDLTD
jgi:hypothetical protein